MEREAYEVGNLCFRDWEDNYKQQTNYIQVDVSLNENKQLRSKIMGINDKRYNTLNKGLMERWGYKLTEEEEEESLNEFGAASSREEPGSGERRKKERGDRYQAHEEIERVEEYGLAGGTGDALSTEQLMALMNSPLDFSRDQLRGLNKSNLTPEMIKVLQGEGLLEEGNDIEEEEEEEEEEIAESALRKLVRETIRRKLKKNG